MKIVRRRISVIIMHDNKILGFKGADPTSKVTQVFVPGGAVEEGESLEAAAMRETLEETGFEVVVHSELFLQRRYDYEWNGKIYDCDTTYFLGTNPQLKLSQLSEPDYHSGVNWVPVVDIDKVFGYHMDVLEPVKYFSGEFLEESRNIHYYLNRCLVPQDVANLYDQAGLKRPTNDLRRIREMYVHSNFVISAWDGNKLVGVSRALTDFSYSCYLSDLAVLPDYQKRGIGKKMIDLTQSKIGPKSNLLLLSAQGAITYYPTIGFENIPNAFLIKRRL